MHTFAAEIRKRLFYQHFVFMFNRFTTTRFLLLSTTVLTLLSSCEQKVTYQIQDDILFTLLDPNNVEGMEQRGDSLYEVYHKAARTAKAEGHQRTASEIDPESIKQKKGTEGLVPGLR